ncbi:hypothetical protein D3C87_2011430 [compost metagenome]
MQGRLQVMGEQQRDLLFQPVTVFELFSAFPDLGFELLLSLRQVMIAQLYHQIEGKRQ